MRNSATGLVDHASVLQVPLAAPPPSVATRHYRKIALGLLASDAAAICTALIVSYWLRFGVQLLPSPELLLIGLAPLVWVPVFQAFSLYRPVYLSPAEEFRRTIGSTGVGVVLLVMVAFWSKSLISRLELLKCFRVSASWWCENVTTASVSGKCMFCPSRIVAPSAR